MILFSFHETYLYGSKLSVLQKELLVALVTQECLCVALENQQLAIIKVCTYTPGNPLCYRQCSSTLFLKGCTCSWYNYKMLKPSMYALSTLSVVKLLHLHTKPTFLESPLYIYPFVSCFWSLAVDLTMLTQVCCVAQRRQQWSISQVWG